jgi:X-Pro dipeptidyl-peptidase
MRSFVTRFVAVLALLSAPLAVAGAASGVSSPSTAAPRVAARAVSTAPTPADAAYAHNFVTNPSAKTENSAPDASPFVLKDGGTSPAYSYKNAIRESVWVKAPDGDGDGKPDLVTADIIRPRELDHKTPVPVIMDASPYYLCCGRGNEYETKTYDSKGEPLKFPLYYDNYFEPRGYAIVLVDMAGTARSTGCADEGAASDVGSIQAVIKWLNGKATATDVNGKPVKAYWANGSVGMIGKSYDGTLANAVAATGIDGLKTVVPISGISSWYDYDRSQNLPFSYDYPSFLSETVESDRTRQVDCSKVNAALDAHDGDATGKYTKFWSQRDYRSDPPPSADKVKASVFLTHGMQDTNVKTINFGDWYKMLVADHVTTKVWLSRLGHTDPFDYRRALWVKTLHEWFDSQLMGIKNGILKQPRVDEEVLPGKWVTSDSWPVSDNNQQLTFHQDGSLTTGKAEQGTDSFTNSPSQSEATAVAQGSNPNRLLYTSGTLTKALRVSGQPTVTLHVTPGGKQAQIGVALVDYGTHNRVRDDGEGNKTLSTQSCWGKSVSYDDSCYYDSVENVVSTPLAVIARGWARLNGGKENTITVNLAYQDTIVPKGDQLGLVIFGASPDWAVTLDSSSSKYSLDLGASSLSLPIVGSISTAANAGDTSRLPSVSALAGVLPTRAETHQLPD